MSPTNKGIILGVIIGLLGGLVSGYLVAPKGDTSGLEQQIIDFTTQVSTLQGQVNDKNNQISNLQSQISTLETQIEELEQRVPPLQKGEWNTIATFTGSTSKTTELFSIPSDTWRIKWTYTGGSGTVFGFYAYPQGHSIFYEESLFTIGPSQSDTTYVYDGPDNYYLKVTTDAEWTIIIEAFIA